MEKVNYFDLFKAYFKIGLILLSGGYVIVPIMQDIIVNKKHWITNEELIDFYCIAGCLPGIVAINTSILTAYKIGKFKGVLSAVFGISLSPFISIIIIARLFSGIMNLEFIQSLFWGINLSVIILIYLALKDMWKKSMVDLFCAFWYVFIIVLAILKISPAVLILSSILLGLIIGIVKKFLTKENKNA